MEQNYSQQMRTLQPFNQENLLMSQVIQGDMELLLIDCLLNDVLHA
ncbi:MAG: hypothetical protein RR931_00925 [Mucinivorans sp.]